MSPLAEDLVTPGGSQLCVAHHELEASPYVHSDPIGTAILDLTRAS